LLIHLKQFKIGSVWRADRPQKGRYRQFTQCDIDMFGVAHETAEIELISATAEALCRLGFRNFSVRLNDRRILANIVTKAGFPQDRIDEVFITIDKLDKIGVAGVRTELESREVEGRRFEKAAVDAIVDFLERVEALSPAERSSLIDEACAGLSDEVTAGLRNIMRVTNSLAKGRYEVVFDPTLVRGMGYYTGPIFELYSKDFGASLGGGGRYDKLVGKFLGKDVPACGFSIGFERILLLIEEQKLLQSTREGKRALFFEYGKDDIEAVFQTAQRERETGGPISVFEKPRKLSNRLTDLVRDGYRFFAVYQTNTRLSLSRLRSMLA
jgi:histidyl-tRNA synthetase